MNKYDVTGMTCAACSARVEKAVLSVEGVESCAVNLLTNSMSVEGEVDASIIIDAVTKAGYGASLKGQKVKEELEDHETEIIQKRLIYSSLLLVVLMYFSMGPMIGIKLPHFFESNPIANGIIQAFLSLWIMMLNRHFFISGLKSLYNRSPNMDTLVSLGSLASYIYSFISLLMMSEVAVNSGAEMASHYLHEFYFESAAMILVLITVGKMLESHSKGKTTNALKSLMDLAPKVAYKKINDEIKVVPIENVQVGDLLVCKAGDAIAVDGEIVLGHAAIDESALTGESVPVDKEVGNEVHQASIVRSGYIEIKATKIGEDTTLAQIIQLVQDANTTKAPIAKIADRVSGVFVPIVIMIALVTTVVWYFILKLPFGSALTYGISVLVISCPCALGLATPVAIMVASGMGAKHNILFKTAISLENTGKIDIVALDKTGTITEGKPYVTDLIELNEDLMVYAYNIERYSEHPLARAIVEKGQQLQLEIKEVKDFETLSGSGVKATIDDSLILGGSLKFIQSQIDLDESIIQKVQDFSKMGKTPLLFTKDNEVLGLIAEADRIKEDSSEAIASLKKMGLKVVMLTGDNEATAKAIGAIAGVDEVYAGVLPTGKEEVIQKLKKEGKVLMVGDGINDALALTSSDIGVAIGAGTDVAIDAADLVLMKNSLSDVVKAIKLSKATLKTIHQNLFWAFFYNSIGIPLAAGVFSFMGLGLTPMFGAAAMSLSSFCVVSNALRLNLLKLDDQRKENQNHMKTITIEGMMCPRCEAHVKKALESLEGVSVVEISHSQNMAKVQLSKEVSDLELTQVIEAEDYKVLGIE